MKVILFCLNMKLIFVQLLKGKNTPNNDIKTTERCKYHRVYLTARDVLNASYANAALLRAPAETLTSLDGRVTHQEAGARDDGSGERDGSGSQWRHRWTLQ